MDWQKIDHRWISNIPLPIYRLKISNSDLIAVYTTSQTAKKTWRLAGYLTELMTGADGLSPSSWTFPTEVVRSELVRLNLNQTQLIKLNPEFGEHEILIQFPIWLNKIEIAVWQSSPLGGTELHQALQSLEEVNQGLDTLLNDSSALNI